MNFFIEIKPPNTKWWPWAIFVDGEEVDSGIEDTKDQAIANAYATLREIMIDRLEDM